MQTIFNCIISACNLDGALVLMMLINSSQIASFEDAVATYFLNYDDKFVKSGTKKSQFSVTLQKFSANKVP